MNIYSNKFWDIGKRHSYIQDLLELLVLAYNNAYLVIKLFIINGQWMSKKLHLNYKQEVPVKY